MRVAAHALAALGSLLVSATWSPVAAQGPYKVGARFEAFLNPTNSGSVQLHSSIYYPATIDGYQTPIVSRAGGLPVLVFLHGYGAIGQNYVELAFDWARAGYVVVLQNTAQTDPALQIKDGTAIFPALVIENNAPGSFYRGKLDTKRMVIGGHSVGGANAVHILANNPGYKAGVAWAPFAGPQGKYTHTSGPKVDVPFAVIGGDGDVITPWKTDAKSVYDNLNTKTLKFLYAFNAEGDHATLVSWLTGKQPQALEVFSRSMLAARGLFEYVLYEDTGSLDHAIGLTGRTDKHVQHVATSVESPCYIKRGVDSLGHTALLQLVAPDGYAIHMLSLARVAIPTPAGTLFVDPASIFILQVTLQTPAGISIYPHPVPKDIRMKGHKFPMQALLFSNARGLELSNSLELAVPK